MSRVRVLAGTRKGAFVLTADGKRKKWDVGGPYFAGWEVYHLKGSPADPDRLYASQSSGWFGQVIQRIAEIWKRMEADHEQIGGSLNRLRDDGVLAEIGTNDAVSQRGLAKAAGVSATMINAYIDDLVARGQREQL